MIIKGNDKNPHTDPSIIEALKGINPWVDQADFDHHGYGKVVATKDAFDCEMVRMQTIKKKTTAKIPARPACTTASPAGSSRSRAPRCRWARSGRSSGVAALVIVTPGPDTALTVRNALLGGRGAGVATAAGVALGLAVWTAAASAGLAALLVASEPAFVAVKLAGAAYLVLLGATTLLHAVRGRGGEHGGRGRRRRARACARRRRCARGCSTTSATPRSRSSSPRCCRSSRPPTARPS